MATRQYIKRDGISTQEMDGPEAPSIDMPRSGDFTRDDVPDIEIVTDVRPNQDDWADNMRFMSAPVTIRIHETNDPNAEPRVPVCVNGEKSHPIFGNHLPRGIEITVKRSVAEVLARAKPINVKTVKTVDHDGNDTARIERKIGQQYPFELVNARPADIDWLKRIRAEA